MLKHFRPLGILLLRLVIYSLVLVGIAQLLFLDAFNTIDGGKFSENSYTEWAQVGLLLSINLIVLWTIRLTPSARVLLVGMQGFFLMSFIREFDFYLDTYVFDGAWQLLAFTVLGLTLFFLFKRREEISEASVILETSAMGLITSGVLITFVFSRLYGRTEFWEAVMEEKYFRSVKNVSEEGIELLGYSIVLIGCIELFRILINSRLKD